MYKYFSLNKSKSKEHEGKIGNPERHIYACNHDDKVTW